MLDKRGLPVVDVHSDQWGGDTEGAVMDRQVQSGHDKAINLKFMMKSPRYGSIGRIKFAQWHF